MSQAVTASDNLLTGKTVLVTGGSRGVGASAARFFAERGANVAINYRSKKKRADEVVNEIESAGRKGLAVEADLTDAASVKALVEQVKDTFGSLDVLVLNASGGLERDAAEDYAMLLNRDAQVGMLEAARGIMSEGGRVIFVTSHLAHFHGQKPVMEEYEVVAVSKRAGETALRERLADLEADGISLVVVSGDLIDGTITPKLLNRLRPGIIEHRREEAGGWLPTTDDFAMSIVNAAADSSLPTGETVFVGDTEWEEWE